MSFPLLDRYQKGDSPLHQLDPRTKLIITLLFILSSVLLPDGAWLAYVATWLLVLLGNRLANLNWTFTFVRSFIVLPFTLAAITVLISLPGEPLMALPFGLTITVPGALRFSSIIIRSWLSVQVAILLTATTSFVDLGHALRHLKMPQILITILSFMYRYLFVLSEEVQRLLRARTARSARIPNSPRPPVAWQAGVAGNMVGQLFLRSYERSDRVYAAMLARGFQGQFLTLNPHITRQQDWLAAAAAVMLLAGVQVLGYLL
jgi:cobalt/nickel transport system permease protein